MVSGGSSLTVRQRLTEQTSIDFKLATTENVALLGVVCRNLDLGSLTKGESGAGVRMSLSRDMDCSLLTVLSSDTVNLSAG